MEETAKGPKSYFPSIESRYGHPIEHWMTELDAVKGKKHMEQVDWLKDEHGFGHGHANALVHVYRQENRP